jgi:hypothetical protein
VFVIGGGCGAGSLSPLVVMGLVDGFGHFAICGCLGGPSSPMVGGGGGAIIAVCGWLCWAVFAIFGVLWWAMLVAGGDGL